MTAKYARIIPPDPSANMTMPKSSPIPNRCSKIANLKKKPGLGGSPIILIIKTTLYVVKIFGESVLIELFSLSEIPANSIIGKDIKV